MKSEENLIHLRVDCENALESKKNILFTEVSLLKIAKIIKRYHYLRDQELELKIEIHRKTKEIDMSLKRLQTLLPKLIIPKILQKRDELIIEEKPKEKSKKKNSLAEKREELTIESQLQAIQEKLKALQK
jgi:hypothetical protein